VTQKLTYQKSGPTKFRYCALL